MFLLPVGGPKLPAEFIVIFVRIVSKVCPNENGVCAEFMNSASYNFMVDFNDFYLSLKNK